MSPTACTYLIVAIRIHPRRRPHLDPKTPYHKHTILILALRILKSPMQPCVGDRPRFQIW